MRAELGYPIMVTPFPQIVCTQALFNVIGGERYGQVPDQVIRYALGKFGRPTSPIDPEIEAVVMDRPRAKEIAAEPDFPDYGELRKRFGEKMNDEEFLLRAVMPEDQVDAMLAAGRSRATYTPEAAPILKLLKELAARPAARDLVVERPGFRCPPCRARRRVKERIASAKGFIFDMDGTLALGDRTSGGHVALPGAVELLKRVKAEEHPGPRPHQRHRQAPVRLRREPARRRLRS